MTEYLIALDIGTTHCKAMLYSSKGERIHQVSEGYPTRFDDYGGAEQQVSDVYEATEKCISRICSLGMDKIKSVRAIVLCSVFHSFICLDKEGNPLQGMITWADMRSLEQSESLSRFSVADDIRKRTGCAVHPMYFPSKVLWLKEERPEIFAKTRKMVSIKEYVLSKWAGEYLVDYSVASGTGMLDEHKMQWDDSLIYYLNINKDYFSTLVDTNFVVKPSPGGPLSKLGLPDDLKIIIGAADGALAHYGTAGFDTNDVSLTVGTGAAIRRTSNKPAYTENGQTWCYYMTDGLWLHGVLVQDAGATYSWLVEEIMKAETDEAMNNGQNPYEYMNRLIAGTPAGSNGLYFLPFLGGERSPNLNPKLRGAVFGLGFNTKRADIARALIEGICYRLNSAYDCLAQMNEDTNIYLSGGFLSSSEWVRTTVDYFNRSMYIPDNPDGSGWGAAILGMKTLKWIDDSTYREIIRKGRQEILPRPENAAVYEKMKSSFSHLYEAMTTAHIKGAEFVR